MKKLIVLGLITLLAMSGIAFAATEHRGAPEFVPQLTEDKLTKIVFIRYAPGFDKAVAKGKPAPSNECYKFLSGTKPKWSWVENYYYSTNKLGDVSLWATSAWDAATSATIFGDGIAESNPWGVYDYKNSVTYGDYDEPGVIAVTAIWFLGKNIYEYDIMFDTDYFPSGGPEKVDLDTVTLHEFGHAAGLGDLYSTVCSSEVMYGYYIGKKTSLGTGDTKGILKLYGA